ncbi:hypothetical protein FUAX_23430 [Fulvitalea axinellae]|uniref:Uncharacterized protein n=1 Tax=Fulvitalea axinellae TaxID=1182444 RepID=A0AAU9DAF7_9BACT|nr:hypothetical protein FUAX_23430 [Fulvitalea axinellae]
MKKIEIGLIASTVLFAMLSFNGVIYSDLLSIASLIALTAVFLKSWVSKSSTGVKEYILKGATVVALSGLLFIPPFVYANDTENPTELKQDKKKKKKKEKKEHSHDGEHKGVHEHKEKKEIPHKEGIDHKLKEKPEAPHKEGREHGNHGEHKEGKGHSEREKKEHAHKEGEGHGGKKEKKEHSHEEGKDE